MVKQKQNKPFLINYSVYKFFFFHGHKSLLGKKLHIKAGEICSMTSQEHSLKDLIIFYAWGRCRYLYQGPGQKVFLM